MLILPERNQARGKILLPQLRREWEQASERKVIFGIRNQTRFRLTARYQKHLYDGRHHIGAIVWRGWFDDREDADEFLFALASGSLRYERELWRLPNPWWPGFGEELRYEFASVSFLTSPTGSNQTWNSPADWNNSDNSIEGIGGGGNGRSLAIVGHATGGGGGQYAKITNFSVATPGTTSATYQIGAVGSGVTWFNSTVDPGAGADNTKLGAKGGTTGNTGTGSQAGGPGGTGGWGTTLNNGGRGGDLTGASGSGGSGGGGAGGLNGAGNNGVDDASTGFPGTNGGSGDAGSGGIGGTGSGAGSGTAGGNGTEWDASDGSGGGGGGSQNNASASSGAGGLYGGGAGSIRVSGGTPTIGLAKQGIIVVTYTPAILFAQMIF